jgi:hypothetical protein
MRCPLSVNNHSAASPSYVFIIFNIWMIVEHNNQPEATNNKSQETRPPHRTVNKQQPAALGEYLNFGTNF